MPRQYWTALGVLFCTVFHHVPDLFGARSRQPTSVCALMMHAPARARPDVMKALCQRVCRTDDGVLKDFVVHSDVQGSETAYCES